jgi:hypothetical protein
MQITIRNEHRVLIKKRDHTYKVDIDNGDIIQYQGIYYKEINDIQKYAHIQTMFVGKVSQCRGDADDITGIYVEPLYIHDAIQNKWKKIMNYEKPTTHYFSYPHLLMLPMKKYRHLPLYLLHTCINVELHDFYNFTEEFYL